MLGSLFRIERYLQSSHVELHPPDSTTIHSISVATEEGLDRRSIDIISAKSQYGLAKIVE